MKMYVTYLILKSSIVFLTISSFLTNKISVTGHSEKEYSLLLISFDGFRWDYLSNMRPDNIPNFQRVISSGVHAKEGLKNVFPTNTLPNHWSMVTGLYPESHGVLDNHMRDLNIQKIFVPLYENNSYQNDFRYYDAGGEPIWVTNQIQKEHGRSGSIMWWGSENSVKWVKPTFQMPYDDMVAFEKRIDTIIQLFNSEYPINLGLVYFPEPDHTAHIYGPNSDEVVKQILNADHIIGYLLKKLEDSDLLDDLNIIITSDHGFTNISKDTVINLDNIIDSSHYDLLTHGPMSAVSIFPKEGDLEEVFSNLHDASIKGQFNVYKSEEIPDRFYYKHNPRVPPILAVAKPPYSFVTNGDNFTLAGNHGYDNEISDMHPFFMAIGPSFKKGFLVDSFNIVDIYPLMCHILGLHPSANNGSMKVVSLLLHDGPENTMWTFGTYILVLIVIASIGGVFTVAACRQHRYLKRRILQLRLSPLQTSIKYSTPPTGDAKTSLLSGDDEDEDDFDDAHDDDKMLEIVTNKW
ncbi:unnamed protein product [Lymnaea stagnalis]|uniref:Uncharacterized protein n=1 Tax=Lymnaea stagnalis TaxID=6523 RepID=A0AAV2HUZ2_LYMST